MPEIVAHRALVFRLLVKGNVDSGNEIALLVFGTVFGTTARIWYVIHGIEAEVPRYPSKQLNKMASWLLKILAKLTTTRHS